VAGRSFSDLIDETVDWLITREGVRDATREDRELVCLWGELDPAGLRIDLLAWWHERLNQIVNQRWSQRPAVKVAHDPALSLNSDTVP